VLFWMNVRTNRFWIPRFTFDEIGWTYRAYAGSVVALVILVALMVFSVVRRPVRKHLVLLLSWMLLPVIVPIIISLYTLPMFTARYAISVIVPIAILTAAGIVLVARRAAVQLLIATALGALLYFVPRTLDKPDWRSAGAYLQHAMRPGDYAFLNDRLNITLYRHYVNRPDVRNRGMWDSSVPLGLPLAKDVHAWVMTYTPDVPLRDIIERGHWRVVSQKAFGDIVIFELANGATDEHDALPPEQRFAATRPAR
jgi:hypothetical protein